MDFFIPQIADPAKAEEVWQSVKSFMEMQGQSVTDRRIFRLDYVHNGKEWEAEVGEPHPYGHPTTWEYVPDYDDPKAGEWVVAILEAEVVTTSSARTIGGSSAANRSSSAPTSSGRSSTSITTAPTAKRTSRAANRSMSHAEQRGAGAAEPEHALRQT